MLLPYQLVCFDFDGLLVDSEPVHYRAYLMALEHFGVPLALDYAGYAVVAHHPRGNILEELVRAHYPSLATPWAEIRAFTKERYRELITTEAVALMPGAIDLITLLHNHGIDMCVVTNSSPRETNPARKSNPILDMIPLWITSDCYTHRKPHPDGYLTALAHFPALPKEKVVALEDTMRGVRAIVAAGITPILIGTPANEPDIELIRLPSLHALL